MTLFYKMITFDMDIGSKCRSAELYKLKIGPLRPQIYLILSPGPRLLTRFSNVKLVIKMMNVVGRVGSWAGVNNWFPEHNSETV